MDVCDPNLSWEFEKIVWEYQTKNDDRKVKYLYLLLSDMRAFRPFSSQEVSLVNAHDLGANAVISFVMRLYIVMVLKKLMPDDLIHLMGL
tara:strand:+ start:233 stop:502 length:270 start_codon:yes stop_codon:yes gene_type:complete